MALHAAATAPSSELVTLGRLASAGAYPSVMASPPTITVGAEWTNSTLTGGHAPSVPQSDARMTYAAGKPKAQTGATDFGWGLGECVTPGHVTVGSGGLGAIGMTLDAYWGTDAPSFEFGVANTGYQPFRLWVDELDGKGYQLAQAAPINTPGSSYGLVKILVDWSGVRKPRHYKLEIHALGFLLGLYVGAQDRVWKTPVASGPRLMVVSDSYGAGFAISNFIPAFQSFARTVGHLVGVPDTWVSAVGGTGYLNDGSGGQATIRGRIADITDNAPDYLIVALGANDGPGIYTASALQAEVGTFYTQLMTALPSAKVLVVGPWAAPALSSDATTFSAIKTAVQAQASYGSRLFLADNWTTPWQFGTGKVGSTTGDGNADFYITSDGGHPNQAGHDYLASRVTEAFKTALAL